MEDNNLFKKNPSGVTLLLVMLILSIVASVALGVTFLILRQFQQGGDVEKAAQARNGVDSGIEEVLLRLKSARGSTASAEDFLNQLGIDFNCDTPKVVGEASFCVNDTQSTTSEQEIVSSLEENQSLTMDVYDPEDPTAVDVKAIKIDGSTDPATWLEVSWIAWNIKGDHLEFLSTTTKTFFSNSELPKTINLLKIDNPVPPDVYLLNNPRYDDPKAVVECTNSIDATGCITGDNLQLNLVVRIKALYGAANEIRASACSDPSCDTNSLIDIPTRANVKIIGKSQNAQQAALVSFPWNASLAALFDYVIFSKEGLTKDVSVVPTFYASGTQEAERGVASYSGTPPFTCNGSPCTGWQATPTNATCQQEPGIGAHGNATCRFTANNGIIDYSVSSLGLDPAKYYYVNFGVKVSSQSTVEAMKVVHNDASPYTSFWFDESTTIGDGGSGSQRAGDIEYNYRDKDGFLTCTSNTVLFKSGDTLQFQADPASATSPRPDWFSITSYPLVNVGTCRYQAWNNVPQSTVQMEAGLDVTEACGTDSGHPNGLNDCVSKGWSHTLINTTNRLYCNSQTQPGAIGGYPSWNGFAQLPIVTDEIGFGNNTGKKYCFIDAYGADPIFEVKPNLQEGMYYVKLTGAAGFENVGDALTFEARNNDGTAHSPLDVRAITATALDASGDYLNINCTLQTPMYMGVWDRFRAGLNTNGGTHSWFFLDKVEFSTSPNVTVSSVDLVNNGYCPTSVTGDLL